MCAREVETWEEHPARNLFPDYIVGHPQSRDVVTVSLWWSACYSISSMPRFVAVCKNLFFVFLLTNLMVDINRWRSTLTSDEEAICMPTGSSTSRAKIEDSSEQTNWKNMNFSSLNQSAIVPPYYPFSSTFFTVPRYHLATCKIEKNMATIRMATFCYLNDPKKFRDGNRTISTDSWNRECWKFNTTHRSFDETARAIGPKMLLFAVLRQPVDRFLSGYIHVCLRAVVVFWRPKHFGSVHLTFTVEKPLNCPTQYHHAVCSTTNLPKFSHIGMGVLHHALEKNFRPRLFNETGKCFGCGSDMRCFVEGLHRFLFDFYNNRIERTRLNNVLIDHFAPQTWPSNWDVRRRMVIFADSSCSVVGLFGYCEFEKHKKDFIFINYHDGPERVPRVANEFGYIFRKAGVPPHLRDVIHAEMLKGSVPHMSANSPKRRKVERQLLSDEYLLKHLREMYFHDYFELGLR